MLGQETPEKKKGEGADRQTNSNSDTERKGAVVRGGKGERVDDWHKEGKNEEG